MTAQLAITPSSRIRLLIVVGVTLISAGIYSSITLLSSVFARYMHVEDLGLDLDENMIFQLTRITDTDRGILIMGAVLVALGAAALVSAIVRRRSDARRRR